MWGSEALEVAIGFVFILLTVSLAATTLREIIEGLLKSRAIHLERGIRQLLDDPSGTALTKDIYNHPLLYALFSGDYDPADKLRSFLLRRDTVETTEDGQPVTRWAQRLPYFTRLPSYIPSRNFALALMDLVGGSAGGRAPLSIESVTAGASTLPDGRLKQALLVALGESKGDLDRARASLEAWYDGTMDRVSGWYKRETQTILLGLGLSMAVLLNIDSLSIMKELWSNNLLRVELVNDIAQTQAQAEAEAEDGTENSEDAARSRLLLALEDVANRHSDDLLGWQSIWRRAEQIRELPTDTNNIGEPLNDGTPLVLRSWCTRINKQVAGEEVKVCSALQANILSMLAAVPGWLLTAAAASLGAPFWFDLLNKLMVIRSTVKPYEKSPPEGSEDRTGQTSPGAERLDAVSTEGAPVSGLANGNGGGTSSSAGQAYPGAAELSEMAHLRLAVETESFDQGTGHLVVFKMTGGEPETVWESALPEKGMVEVPLAVGELHRVEVHAQLRGNPVTGAWAGVLSPSDDGEPAAVQLQPA